MESASSFVSLDEDHGACSPPAMVKVGSDPQQVLPHGRDLLNPEHAQHAQMLRFPAFISAAEIEVIKAEALRHRACHPGVCETLYLQHGGIHHSLAPIVARIHDQVWRVDAEIWGLNAVHRLEGVSGAAVRELAASGCDNSETASVADAADGELSGDEGDDFDARSSAASASSSTLTASFAVDGAMRPRTIEFHEYSVRGRRICGTHSDYGSLFTADVMLSQSSDFEGGRMVSTVLDGGGIVASQTWHAFEQGDLLVFPAHKPHSVERVTDGTRLVFVIEFWRGPACTCNSRCMGYCGWKAGNGGSDDGGGIPGRASCGDGLEGSPAGAVQTATYHCMQ